MEKLTNPGVTRAVLAQYGIRARKKYGQNFLTDRNIVRGIIAEAGITQEDCVLEIGPGIGTMTQYLSDAAGRVVCVEIDENLRPVLAQTLEDCDNVEVIWQDILKTDLDELAESRNEGRPLKVVANLPYYVTTPILLYLLEKKGRFESITVMVQKEVADRICAHAGSREYGALSLAVQYYADPQIVLRVPPACFLPRPNVESAVLHLQAYTEPPVEADEGMLFALVRASFNQRRKTLANGLSHGFRYQDRTLSRAEVEEALAAMGLPADIRGEKLSLDQFADLSRRLLSLTSI
ncbi:MAG: 16S rRNA (adenine(1518)-N(6)/adenine(1519)-N(6))-dimethyltransferase RsmA [Eubacteriales bacterium]|nr:16S rRNA (adenine(1518)-N(6)/adenine(1519)-N(6))-dimethyltransferase RsmA [Eubacteriales bacterium]